MSGWQFETIPKGTAPYARYGALRLSKGATGRCSVGARKPQTQSHLWVYSADETEVGWPARGDLAYRLRDNVASIHMPRAASRLTLSVTDVRIQRVQDINEEDAIAEGIKRDYAAGMTGVSGWHDYLRGDDIAKRHFSDPRDSYRTLWNSIYGAGSWEANPYVAVYGFKTYKQNIDTFGQQMNDFIDMTGKSLGNGRFCNMLEIRAGNAFAFVEQSETDAGTAFAWVVLFLANDALLRKSIRELPMVNLELDFTAFG